jgi:hypothetical protein
MLHIRKVTIPRKINDKILMEISLKSIKHNEVYGCCICESSVLQDKKIEHLNIHKDCLAKMPKCSDDKCPVIYYSSSQYIPMCTLCNSVKCTYHILSNSLCLGCNNHYTEYILFVLKRTAIYKNVDVLKYLLTFFEKPLKIFF